MIKNYFKIAWRNLIQNKTFSSINILGLALGMVCSLLIFLWVLDERSIDSFHENINQTYIVTSQEYIGNQLTGTYDTPGLLAEELKLKIPEIELACNYSWNSYHTFSVNEKALKIPGNYAGKDFFKMFSYPLILGSKETALTTPESIVVSEKMATSLFGSAKEAIDKTVRFENYRDLKITGVFEDVKENSSEKFEYIINWTFFIERNQWLYDWDNSGPQSFVTLKAEANPIAVEAKIKSFIANYNEEYAENNKLELGLQRYDEKYLHSNFKNGFPAGGRIDYVNLFTIVAIFILLIACINFMNLSTARSLKRAKEIGVRKVIGARRSELIKQFLAEALLYTLLAVLISIVVLVVLLPLFNNLTGKQISSPLNNSSFWFGIFILTLATGLISGSYPAFLLSSFKPISVLKTNIKINPKSGAFRKGLVIFQFALSILFIVGMIVVSEQVSYIQTKNLGYQKNNLIYVPITGNMAGSFDVFKNKALEIHGITDISKMSQRPVEIENTTSSVEWQEKSPDTKINFTQVAVGYDFIETMQSEMIQGRDFSKDYADTNNYIINETALKTIGYIDPIGKPLTFWGVKGTIVGVIKDFHFNSLHVPIEPLIIRMTNKKSWGMALIRIDSQSTQTALASLEELHQELNPDFPFAHQYADEEYASLYQSEQVVEKLSGYFAFLAIFISCLGLLGLVLFTAEQRKREISIRKVLGANVQTLIKLLSKDFLIMVVIAFVITIPIAWLTMQKWLENFEYVVAINWVLVFAIAGVSVLTISLITVSYQALKAAVANPVKNLKTE